MTPLTSVISKLAPLLNGGGGGVSCASSLPALGGSPFGDLEDDIIGGDLTITGWQSCWLGFFRDAIARHVDFNNNVTADPDGNEMGTNSIGGNLSCTGTPRAHKSATPGVL